MSMRIRSNRLVWGETLTKGRWFKYLFFLRTRLVFLCCLWRCGNKFLLRSSNFGVPDSPGTFFVTITGGLDCVLGCVRCWWWGGLCAFLLLLLLLLFGCCCCCCVCLRACVCMLRELYMQEPKCRHWINVQLMLPFCCFNFCFNLLKVESSKTNL